MKFIRDIISEKSRLSAKRAAVSPHPELVIPQSQPAMRRPQPETDLEPADTSPSFSDPSETISDDAEQPINASAISWDTPISNDSVDTGDELPDMSTQPDAEPEVDSDLDVDPYLDAMKALDLVNEETQHQDKMLRANDLDDLDPPEVASEEPHNGIDMSGLDVPIRADDIEAFSTIEKSSQDALDQFFQTQESKISQTSAAETAGSRTNLAETKINQTREANIPSPHVEPPYDNLNGTSPISQEAIEPSNVKLERSHTSDIDQINTDSGLPGEMSVPAPAVGRSAARAGRAKTRLLGFNPGQNASSDPFDNRKQQSSAGYTQYPVGWLIVVDGHGVGSAFTLFDGVSQIGRGSDQTVCLDFGDNSISRESHAVVAYDSETRKFFLGHGGKTNLVRLNNRPVLSTEEIETGNTICIGETTLRFVGLCGGDFQWQDNLREDRRNASFS